jgi:integrase/recombinase XerD
MEEVSKALGHGSIKATENFYNPWIKTRPERLDGLVMGTWE